MYLVAVDGLEPPTFLWYEWRRFILGTITAMTTKTFYQLNYTAYRIWFICCEAHACAKPCLRYLVIR